MSTLYDKYRNLWVKATPEERVRQQWLEVMVEHLSFPKDLLVIEKALDQLPHMESGCLPPNRRVDVLAYVKKNESLFPLLLVEFKCVPLTFKTLIQVKGYNEFIGAKYVAIANEDHIKVGFIDQLSGEFETIDFLPACPLLLKAMA